MRIKHFCKNLEMTELSPYELKNCPVVIDGNIFFRTMFDLSNWTFVFGCESDKYADYLRKNLSVFKNANVKCYFVFNGGVDDHKIVEKNRYVSNRGIVMPVFIKEIHKQVLDDMNFNYVVCESEAKEQCIALAQKLECPIISFDISFFISGVPYIPFNKMFLNHGMENDGSFCAIQCSIFRLAEFMKKYNLNQDKLATFIVLRDEGVVAEGLFLNFFKAIIIKSVCDYKLNLYLLQWLSRNDANAYILDVLKDFKLHKTLKIRKIRIEELICKRATPDLLVHYLMNGNQVDLIESDKSWFRKGVVAGHIPIQYIGLYKCKTIYGSWSVEDHDAEDSMMLSIGIIKYAFNLLTNFERKEIKLLKREKYQRRKLLIDVTDATAIQKPPYVAIKSPFENGWARIKSLRLFEHFIEESMASFDFNILTSLPEDARLLVIALVYFSHQKSVDTTTEVCSVLLSHVMLGVVADKAHNNNRDIKNGVDLKAATSTSESTPNEELVTNNDSKTAEAILTEYFTLSDTETFKSFNRKLLHQLVEFQHCLHQMNFLNKLCGCPYKPTVYSRTYNGTFIYKIVYDIKVNHSGEAVEFLKSKLALAPTVLAYFDGLKGIYEEMMSR